MTLSADFIFFPVISEISSHGVCSRATNATRNKILLTPEPFLEGMTNRDNELISITLCNAKCNVTKLDTLAFSTALNYI